MTSAASTGDLRYRTPKSMKKVAFQLGEDAGPVIYPKLFRRLATWEVNRRTKMVTGGLIQYLATRAARVCLAADFLLHGSSANPCSLDDFIAPGTTTVLLWPEELVFVERRSGLIDATGELITSW